jgi:glycosyltransferase involved in cell wall biosynthesis
VGGVELYTQTLARYQAQGGSQVAVFYPSPQTAQAAAGETGALTQREENDVRVYAARLGPRSRTRVFLDTFGERQALRALQAVLDREEPDLVHVQHLMGLPASLTNQLQQRRLPIVITLHDYWFVCANAQLLTNYDETVCDGPAYWINCGRCALARAGFGDRPILAPAAAPLLAARGLLLRRILGQAERLIAPTPFVRDVYLRLGTPEQHITIVPHGIEVPDHIQAMVPRARPLREPGQPLHIIYIGGIARQKGLHILIDAVNALPPQQVRLTIYGDLRQHPGYVAQLRAMVRHPGIRFAGKVERSELWQILAQEAHIGIVPTLWYETASLVIQEYFAAGIPVIGSRIGVLPGRIRHGLDGLLFAPGNAGELRSILRRFLDEPSLLENLRSNIQPPHLMTDHVLDIRRIYRMVLEER